MNELFIISEMDELQKILCAINERLQIVAMSVADSKKQVHSVMPCHFADGCLDTYCRVINKPCQGKCSIVVRA